MRETEEFNAEGNIYNPYREKVLDYICMDAFGSKSPTKRRGLFLPWVHGCQTIYCALKQEAQDVI